jgi:hypothetical protein
MSSVETVEGTFELRKVQIRWGRNSGAAAGTDDAVTTHHFLRAPSGVPSDAWVTADFTAVETALATFWTSIKNLYTASTVYKQVRWYKAGPAILPPQGPVRVIDPAVPGSFADTNDEMPPQVAISVTEKTVDATAWGRFYLPNVAAGVANISGRIATAEQTQLADAADVLYEACVAAACFPVVYSAAKPVRTTAGGTSLPARTARALPVKQIQIDDVFDVIRSRRWNEPLLRLQRDIAGS